MCLSKGYVNRRRFVFVAMLLTIPTLHYTKTVAAAFVKFSE